MRATLANLAIGFSYGMLAAIALGGYVETRTLVLITGFLVLSLIGLWAIAAIEVAANRKPHAPAKTPERAPLPTRRHRWPHE